MSENRLIKWWTKPKSKDFYILFIQLAAFLQSGTTIAEALRTLGPHQKNIQVQQALIKVAKDIDAGFGFAESMKRQEIFSEDITASLYAGEKSGQLYEAFQQLAAKMWMIMSLYSKVSNALLTPKIAAVLMLTLILGFSKIVMPQYEKMYSDSGLTMPVIIDYFLVVSNTIFDFWPVTLAAIYGFYYGCISFAKHNPTIIGQWQLKLPIYKKLHFNLLQHEFASNLRLMLTAGVTLPEACIYSAKTVSNPVMSYAIKQCSGAVISGTPFSAALARYNVDKVFDPILLSFISTGEKNGSLPEMLKISTEIFKTEIDSLVNTVGTKLTLIVILPMGLFLIFIYILTLIPMMSYFSQITGT